MNKVEVSQEISKGLSNGARFVSFLYKSKGSGEVAIHNVLLGVSFTRIYRRDLSILNGRINTLNGHAHEACWQLIASIQESLSKGLGNNSKYTQKGVYKHDGKAIKHQVADGDKYYITGYLMKKDIIVEGEDESPKNSRPVTIEKNKIREQLKIGRIRNYALDCANIAGIKTNGKVIEIQVNN